MAQVGASDPPLIVRHAGMPLKPLKSSQKQCQQGSAPILLPGCYPFGCSVLQPAGRFLRLVLWAAAAIQVLLHSIVINSRLHTAPACCTWPQKPPPIAPMFGVHSCSLDCLCPPWPTRKSSDCNITMFTQRGCDRSRHSINEMLS